MSCSFVSRSDPVFKVGTAEWIANGWNPWRCNFLTIQSTKVIVTEPGMIANIQVGTSQASESLFWIRHENLANEVLCLGTQATSFWKVPLSGHNLFKQSHLIRSCHCKRDSRQSTFRTARPHTTTRRPTCRALC